MEVFITNTLASAFANTILPAMVLCGPETRDYLINYARSLIYTTALGFPFLASIRTAYELLSSGETVPVWPLPILS